MIGFGLLSALACRDASPEPEDGDGPEAVCQGGGTPFAEGELFGTDVTFVDATDWDGDGDVDVFVRHLGTTFGMYEHVGGSWAPYQELVAESDGDALIPIAVMDLDGDADADVLSVVRGRPQRWPYNNTVTFHERLDGDVLADPVDVLDDIDCFEPYVLADAEGDGDDDLFCKSPYYGVMQIVENDGLGEFREPIRLAMSWPSTPADFDGDGDADFVARGLWIENTGGAALGLVDRELPYDGWPFGWGGTPEFVTSVPGDLDGDGDLDIAAFVLDFGDDDNSLSYVGWWSNQGEGRFAALRGLVSSPSVELYDAYETVLSVVLETADLDGDGDHDVLYGDSATRLTVFEAVGNGALVELHSVPFVDGFGHARLRTADLDGDGDGDILSDYPLENAYGYYEYVQYSCYDDNDCGLYRYRNEFSGAPDTDDDGTCDQDDRCPGFHDAADTDLDGIPNGCDTCQSAVDSDGDGRSDDCDVCPGTPDDIDGDLDGVPDVCDPCPTDPVDDSDGDDVCESDDACLGYDLALDADGDGICNDKDLCDGDNTTGDSDLDHVCDEIDACPGHPDLVDQDVDGIPDDCDDDIDTDY